MREIILAGKNLTIRIHELDELYDSITGRVRTGAWVWDASIVLSNYLSTQTEFNLKGKRVLELGAGAGLPGLTAALLGAGKVVLTDYSSLLPGLQRNAEVNGVGDVVEGRELVWGSDESATELKTESGEFDLVLMSDVFFDVVEMLELCKTLRRVCRKESKVWAATELRLWTVECLNELESKGFKLTELPSHLVLSNCAPRDMFVIFEVIPPV